MTRAPYFSQDGVTIYHGACVDVLAEMEARSVGFVFLDPPYTESTHKAARTNKGKVNNSAPKQIDFPSITMEDLRDAFDAIGRVARRWVVATSAYQHVAKLEEEPPSHLCFIRCGVWTKVAPTPQMNGDRPGVGWEAVAILHADEGEKMRWARGGAVWSVALPSGDAWQIPDTET